jgi:hypothetical protein
MFRFFELLLESAKEILKTIKTHVPISNFNDFAKDCEGHVLKLAKLNNIAQKPYLMRLTMVDIRKTIKNFSLNVQVAKIGGKEMLVYDDSDKWGILNLLDDYYLMSEMTGAKYDVNSKREHA